MGDERGAHLVFPLLRLAPAAAPAAPRLLHLDERTDAGLNAWVLHVRHAVEACLVVDGAGRVAAMSVSCGALLQLDPVATLGILLLELLVMVDFSAVGVPLPDPEVHAPPLQSLASGYLTRGLVRLRNTRQGLATFDVVGVPLAGGVGALAFVTAV